MSLFKKNRAAAADSGGDVAVATDERIDDERDRDDDIEAVAPDPVDQLEPARRIDRDERVEQVDEVADDELEPIDSTGTRADALTEPDPADEVDDSTGVRATVPPPAPPEPIPQPGPDPVPEPAPPPGPGPDPAPEPIPPPGPGPDPVPQPLPQPDPDPVPDPGPLTRDGAGAAADQAAADEAYLDEIDPDNELEAEEVVAIDLRDDPTAIYPAGTFPDEPPPTLVTEGGPLLPDAGVWEQRFTDVQVAFVDDPGLAIHDADKLVTEAMEELAKILLAHRESLQAQWRESEAPDTEHLRLTFQGYRALLFGLLSA